MQVLVGLATTPGRAARARSRRWPRWSGYTGPSERTVRTCLDRLAAEGIIAPCDPGIMAARIKRADPRPQGWDLNLSLVCDDLDSTPLAVLDSQFLGLRRPSYGCAARR